jgi:hypothetical protein
MSISTNTRVTLTIGGIITAVIALVALGWRANGIASDIKSEIADLRRELKASATDRWTTGDMERWSVRLERSNREFPLVVPDPRETRADRSQ